MNFTELIMVWGVFEKEVPFPLFLPSYLLLTVAQVILPSKVLHCN